MINNFFLSIFIHSFKSINTFFNFGAAGWSEPQQIGASELIEIGKRGPRKQLAKANLELVNEYVKFNKFKLKMDVREAYVKLVAAKSILHTLKQHCLVLPTSGIPWLRLLWR